MSKSSIAICFSEIVLIAKACNQNMLVYSRLQTIYVNINYLLTIYVRSVFCVLPKFCSYTHQANGNRFVTQAFSLSLSISKSESQETWHNL
jgi:hypothetical protein